MCLEGENSECFTLLLENVSLSSIFWGWELLSASCFSIWEYFSSYVWRWECFEINSCSVFLRVRDSECLENNLFSIFLRGRDSECFEKSHFHFFWGGEILSVSRKIMFTFLEGERFWVYREQLILIIFPEVDSLNVWRTIYVHVSWGWEFLSVSWTISFHFTWGCDFLSVSVSENMFPEHLF